MKLIQETTPKVAIQDKQKMKFNWRANWEILLVFVIIVVGIVITTIAAIRNKDKHLLVLPEETDFGQLLSGGGSSEHSSLVPHQTDFNNAQVSNTLDDDTSTRKPNGKQSHPSVQVQHSINRDATHSGHSHRNHQTAATNHANRHANHDDHPDQFNRPISNDRHHGSTGPVQVSLASNDAYDASSTEPTLSQIRSTESTRSPPSNHRLNSNDHLHNSRHNTAIRQHHLPNTRRNATRPHKLDTTNQPTPGYSDPMDESVELVDDIHTTRSSLAGNGNQHSGSYTRSGSSNSSPALPSPQSEQMPNTPSLALHGPYGVTPPPIEQLGQLINQHNTKAEPPTIDTEEMMTSYSRIPSNSSTPDSMLRDYNSASPMNNSTQHLQLFANPLLTSLMSGNSAGGSTGVEANPDSGSYNQNHFSFPAYPKVHSSLPFSVLLSDLIKFTRSTPLVNTQANIEQPANTRPQQSILQQLRSLPGPLLSLLQGSSNESPNTVHELGGSPSHDASESSQHYHRIPATPTDVHSILARSMRSSNVLPAFPPPKGTPHNWIPPTSGGSPNYHDAYNTNADFVANNVAGFVRANGQQPHGQQTNEHPMYQSNHQYEQNNHRSSNENGSQHHAISEEIGIQQTNHKQLNQYNGQEHSEHHHPQQPAQQPPMSSNQAERNLLQTNQQPPIQQNNGGRPSVLSQPMEQNQIDNPHRLQRPISNNNQPPDYGHQVPMQPQSLVVAPMNQQQQQQNVRNNPSPLAMNYNQASVYNSRPFSEMPVPLGYNPQQSNQHLNTQNVHQQPRSPSLDFNGLQGESAPKASISSSVIASVIGKHSPPQSIRQGSSSNMQLSYNPSKGLNRRKRTLDENYEPNSSGSVDNGDDDDDGEFLDSRQVSVVMPDGRPMAGARIERKTNTRKLTKELKQRYSNENEMGDGQLAPSPSYRRVNHADIEQNALHHYVSPEDRQNIAKHKLSKHSKMSEKYRDIDYKSKKSSNARERYGRKRNRSHSKKGLPLDTAGSGLVSKLLGTASTNDESEEDIDSDDEDGANERRKEEIDDAEFGLVNDENHSNKPTSSDVTNNNSPGEGTALPSPETNQLQDNNDSSLGAGSTDNEAYARRHQQRSDIEFYGNHGKETRQLKYGILGSGNYEVVNGGIYPEADESTAAVNSVANYVRKPSVLLASLPKLLAGHDSVVGGQEAAFMPGGRVGGLLHGASAVPDDLSGMVQPGDIGGKGYSSPLMELIDANGGQLFDPNLVAQLGSSGTSARTTYASKDSNEDDQRDPAKQDHHGFEDNLHDGDTGSSSAKARLRIKSKSRLHNKNFKLDGHGKLDSNLNQGAPNTLDDEQRTSKLRESGLARNKPQGTNQFNSYQISPSKKVTIFSDQDLDSSPNEIELQTVVHGHNSHNH